MELSFSNYDADISLGSDKKLLVKRLKDVSLFIVKAQELRFSAEGQSFDEWLSRIDLNRFFYTLTITKLNGTRPAYISRIPYIESDSAILPSGLVVIPADNESNTLFKIKTVVNIHGTVDLDVYVKTEMVDLRVTSELPASITNPLFPYRP